MEAKIYNCKWWIKSCDAELLKETINNILIRSNFSIFKSSEHYFQPMGYTSLWLLGESHASVHTFPECGWSYMELSSCSREMFFDFIDFLPIEFERSYGYTLSIIRCDIYSTSSPVF